MGNEWIRFAADMDGWLRFARRLPTLRPGSILGVPTRPPSLRGAFVSFVSDFTRRSAMRDGCFDFAETVIAQPGVALADFPIEGLTAAPRDFAWRLLYVGRLDENKGIETILHALPLLPDTATLNVVGGGGEWYERDLRDLAAELGVASRVTFRRADRASVRAWYTAPDAVVFPSVWDEPFGLVPLEAMACGVPVVATGSGGSGEFLVDGDNCLLFEKRDHRSLAALLHRVASDPQLRTDLRAGGRATAERLTAERYARQLLDIHIRAIGSRVRASI